MTEIVKTINGNGTVEWKLNGLLHRVDGPAVEWADGLSWYKNGKKHRVDGPAYDGVDGTKCWYIDGLLHRVDGPAIEWADGKKEYWYKGKRVTKKEFCSKLFKIRITMEE